MRSKNFSYDVVMGGGAWKEMRRFPMARVSSVFLLTERPLWGRWGKKFLRDSALRNARAVFVPAGETSKKLSMVERLAAELLAAGADRHSLLIAIGGGVVGDLGGFLASTYMRGIDYIQVPTTVVAQVDSAIGGKTGVDVGAMKNLIGTTHPPRIVLANPSILASLPERVFRSGLYEVVKHAILAGPPLFTELETRLDSLSPRDGKALAPLLARAARVKAEVVSRDEREAGLRRILNLGHTFGHALEAATDYRRFLHGEAVGWGLFGAIRVAERLGVLHPASADQMAWLVRRVGPLPPIHDIAPAKVLNLLAHDKKAVGGKVHWVLPEQIGKVRIVVDVPPKTAAAAFRDVQNASRDGLRRARFRRDE